MTFNNIILYDSDCGFCDKFRSLVCRIAPDVFKFTPLKSENGTKLLASLGLLKTYRDKIILIQGSKSFFGSSCVLKMCRYLPFPYRLLYILYFVPKFFREPLYCLFAKYRHKFSKNNSCSV